MNPTNPNRRRHRVVALVAALLLTSASSACSDDSRASTADPTPAGTATSPSSVLPPLSEPGDTVTDIAGPTDVGISFVVPDGAEEFDDGVGKRAYRVGGGWLMVGAARAYYTLGRDGLLRPRDPGNDPAAALAALRTRDDLAILAQGQREVAGESALVVAFRTKPSSDDLVSDLWCFQDEVSCYKMPVELTGTQVVVPWGSRLLVVHSEWEKSAEPPRALVAARDELLRSLRRG